MRQWFFSKTQLSALAGNEGAGEHEAMNLPRLLPAVIVGCGLFLSPSLKADAPPFALSKQYSADVVITNKKGETINNHMAVDNGKIRNETTMHGMNMVMILRPDLLKTYMVMPDSKMVMELPYNADKWKKKLPPMSTDDGTTVLVGPEVVDGTATLKYKMTNKDNKVFYIWVDAVKQVPVKMTAEDGSFTSLWKNYTTGPQTASLFEPPAGYQVMSMPSSGGGFPGGGALGQ